MYSSSWFYWILKKTSSIQRRSWSKCPIFIKRRCIFLFLVFLTDSGGKYTSATSHHPSSQNLSSFNLSRTGVIAKVSCIFIYLLEKNRKKRKIKLFGGHPIHCNWVENWQLDLHTFGKSNSTTKCLMGVWKNRCTWHLPNHQIKTMGWALKDILSQKATPSIHFENQNRIEFLHCRGSNTWCYCYSSLLTDMPS